MTIRSVWLVPLLLACASAHAVVIRDDVDDAEYRIAEAEIEALVDMPHEGHGVLIAPQWILTAAHVVTSGHPIDEVMLGGMCLKVDRVVVHPGYVAPPAGIYEGDAARAMRFQAGRDDVALLHLVAPVPGIAPVPLYRGDGEVGREFALIGRGATGDGSTGFDLFHAPHRTELRRAYNTVATADERWLGYTFDAGAGAHPREGASGSGDSGGPLLIVDSGRTQLAGLTAWVYTESDIASFRPGTYGLTNYAVRVSRYAGWIDGVVAGDAAGP